MNNLCMRQPRIQVKCASPRWILKKFQQRFVVYFDCHNFLVIFELGFEGNQSLDITHVATNIARFEKKKHCSHLNSGRPKSKRRRGPVQNSSYETKYLKDWVRLLQCKEDLRVQRIQFCEWPVIVWGVETE